MSGFLYYSSTKTNPVEDMPHAFQRTAATVGCLGPDGKRGAIYAPPGQWDNLPQRLGHYQDKQTWIQEGAWWIGRYNEQADLGVLERPQQLAGKLLELGDGQQWHIPIARSIDFEGQHTHIPRRFTRANGEWVYGDCVPEFKELWEATADHLETIVSAAKDGQSSATLLDEVRLAVLALKANYRVSDAEVALLQLLDNQRCAQIVGIVVDLSGLEKLQKKTDQDTLLMNDGNAA